jgi:ribonuclease HI
LTTPSGEDFYYSYRLEYHCTNNIAEYEALILGFNLEIGKGVTYLKEKRRFRAYSVTSVDEIFYEE